MERMARDVASFRAAMHPDRGLLLVEYFSDASGEDPDADENGTVARARRLCGTTLDDYLARAQRDLHHRLNDADARATVTCEPPMCSFAAMVEFDLAGELRFGDGYLDSIVRVESAGVSESFLAAARAHVTASLGSHASGRCDAAAQ